MQRIPNIPSGTSRWNSATIPERVRDRAFEKWTPDGDCWISTYSTASHGYAQIGWSGPEERRVVLAHRASWERVHGPVPAGMTLDHICKTKRCVNPKHLRLLSNFENARRTFGRDWPLGECVNGHSNENLETFTDGRTGCGICAKTIWKQPKRTERRERETSLRIVEPRKPAPPRTHCRNGHEKSDENSYIRPNGRRECLPCKVAHARSWHGQQAAA